MVNTNSWLCSYRFYIWTAFRLCFSCEYINIDKICRVLFIIWWTCVLIIVLLISHAEYALGASSNTMFNTCNFNSSYTTTPPSSTPATHIPVTPTTTPNPAVIPGICMCYNSHCSCIFRTHVCIWHDYILQRGKYLFQPDPINTVDSTQFLSQLHHHLLTLLSVSHFQVQ